MPLVFGGEVLGVIDIQSDRLNEFTEDDRFLFEALADTVAVAMRNAFLYRSEKWRRQVADSLHDVAGLLSADVDLDQVLNAVLAELRQNLPCDVAAIWLLGENDSLDELPSGLPGLHLAAILGAEKAIIDLNCGVQIEDLLQKISQAQPGAEKEDLSSWMSQALTTDIPIIRTLDSPYEPLGRACAFPPEYSAIAAPLRVGEQTLGLLALAHHTPGRYGSEAQAMTASFASYASVAIENARLYEAAHEQAWVSTVLLQVAEASQNLSNLHELLSTVVRITPMLIGVRSCALYMWDDLEEAFAPAAYEGLSSEQKTEFERWRFAAGDLPVLDRLRQEKKPIILHGLEDDPHLAAGGQIGHVQALLLALPREQAGELQGRILIAHYAATERGFVDAACRQCFGAGLLVPTVDTLVLAHRSCVRQGLEPIRGDLRLAALRERYNLPAYASHDALVDAIAAAELFLAKMEELAGAGPVPLKAFLAPQ